MLSLTQPPTAVYRIWKYLPGRVQRWLVHVSAPKITHGVAAVICDEQGRILVARHVYRRQPWSMPGGLVDRGEQPAEALARELHEELGVDAVVGRLLHAETCIGTSHLTLYYQVTLAGVPAVNMTEIDQVQFCAPADWSALTSDPAPLWLKRVAYREPTAA
jgi:8-oxo-dGTP pyrophosphatase MutT (NUDIX family)